MARPSSFSFDQLSREDSLAMQDLEPKKGEVQDVVNSVLHKYTKEDKKAPAENINNLN